jgi:glycosyltransferase involved in cell wall biosynthesis
MKIDFYTNLIPPYRASLFRELGQISELTVHTAAREEVNRGWTESEKDSAFSHINHDLPRMRIKDTWFYFPILDWLKDRGGDVVIIGGWENPANHFLILASILRKKRVAIFYESTENDSTYSRITLVRKIKSTIFRSVHFVITVGKQSTCNVKNLGVAADRIVEAFNGIDYEWWSVGSVIRTSPRYRDRQRFIYVGQLIERKRVALLIDSFARIARTDDTLYIVGAGPLRADLEIHASNVITQGRVEFTGSMDSVQLRTFYQSMDTLVLPSNREVWGMVVLEALASNLTVVVSKECGVSTEIENLIGVYIFESPDDLENCLKEARENECKIDNYDFFQNRSIQSVASTILAACISHQRRA